MLAQLLADTNWLNPEFEFSPNPGPYIAVFFVGFLIAVFGHISQSKTLIAAGLLMIFLATVLLPVGIYLSG
jgi:hypothetical protein